MENTLQRGQVLYYIKNKYKTEFTGNTNMEKS